MSPDVYDNVNVIAGTLKLFLRLLPIPVVTFEVHPQLCSAAGKFVNYVKILN
jgi:hypothetical protein